MSAVLTSIPCRQSRALLVLENYLSSMVVLGAGYVLYTKFLGYHIGMYNAAWRADFGFWSASAPLRSSVLFLWVLWAYAVVLVPFYWLQPALRSKASVFLRYVFSVQSLQAIPRMSKMERQAGLVLLLKFFFMPFCLNGFLSCAAGLNANVLALVKGGSVDVFSLLLSAIYFVDFLPFALGYVLECRWLKNEIVSVDSTLSGWVVCLLCYPPFNAALAHFLPWSAKAQVAAFAVPDPVLRGAFNAVLVALFFLFACASLSLGLKCSNLTNRGTVTTGLYAFCRHPAYASKNLAWWIAAVPVLVTLWGSSPSVAVFGAFCLACWSALYVARAITEERHLLRIDTGYAAYMARVRWRFIPGFL
jgi:protein-S-isoprenylcysteine O-methyltransferase Ste14